LSNTYNTKPEAKDRESAPMETYYDYVYEISSYEAGLALAIQ